MNFEFPKRLAYKPYIRGVVLGKNNLGRNKVNP